MTRRIKHRTRLYQTRRGWKFTCTCGVSATAGSCKYARAGADRHTRLHAKPTHHR